MNPKIIINIFRNIPGLKVSTGTESETVMRHIYLKSRVLQIPQTLMLMMLTLERRMLYLQLPIQPLQDFIYLLLDLHLLKEGMMIFKSVSI